MILVRDVDPRLVLAATSLVVFIILLMVLRNDNDD
jgi:hypothetical protein